MIDIAKANQDLGNAEPQAIIDFAVNAVSKPLVSTNFRPHEAVILHMATKARPDIPVLWVDSGYNTRETYLVAEQLIDSLNLNVVVYTPTMTSLRWDSAHGGIPDVDDARHDEFTDHFKLEPFGRGMREQAPEVWLTAVRADQTAFRQGMEIFGTGPDGVIKVAPLLNWKEADMDKYLAENDLPNVENYFDPTKGPGDRECGLHTRL